MGLFLYRVANLFLKHYGEGDSDQSFLALSVTECSKSPLFFNDIEGFFLVLISHGMALLYQCSVPRPVCVGETASSTHLE